MCMFRAIVPGQYVAYKCSEQLTYLSCYGHVVGCSLFSQLEHRTHERTLIAYDRCEARTTHESLLFSTIVNLAFNLAHNLQQQLLYFSST